MHGSRAAPPVARIRDRRVDATRRRRTSEYVYGAPHPGSVRDRTTLRFQTSNFAMDEDPFTSQGSVLSLRDPFEEGGKTKKRDNSSEDPFTSLGSVLSLRDPFKEGCKQQRDISSAYRSDRGVQLSDPFADFSDATNFETRPLSKKFKPGTTSVSADIINIPL